MALYYWTLYILGSISTCSCYIWRVSKEQTMHRQHRGSSRDIGYFRCRDYCWFSACQSFSRDYIETGLIPIGALGITMTLFLIPLFSSLTLLAILFFFYGLFSGFLIVPLNTLIQFASPKRIMGKVLAGNNFMQNVSMFIFFVLTSFCLLYTSPSPRD